MEAYMLFLTFSSFLSSFPLSLSLPDKEFRECTPYPCGKVGKIEYPFWSDQSRTRYCGRPGFLLICPQNKHDYPSIQINSQTFSVTHIDLLAHKMTLVRTDFVYNDFYSYAMETSVSTPLSLFHYDEHVKNVTIFYNCTDHMKGGIQFQYEYHSNSKNFAFYSEDVDFQSANASACYSFFEVPVSIEFDVHTQNSSQALLEALGRGFSVQYDVDKSCAKCLGSHGICGSIYSSPFICYCPDGHHPHSCPYSSDSSGTCLFGRGRSPLRDQWRYHSLPIPLHPASPISFLSLQFHSLLNRQINT